MPVATSTIIAAAAVASAAAGIGSAVVSATSKPKTPSFNNNIDPGAVKAAEARTDTGADIKLGSKSNNSQRASGKKKAGASLSAGSGLGKLKPAKAVGGF